MAYGLKACSCHTLSANKMERKRKREQCVIHLDGIKHGSFTRFSDLTNPNDRISVSTIYKINTRGEDMSLIYPQRMICRNLKHFVGKRERPFQQIRPLKITHCFKRIYKEQFLFAYSVDAVCFVWSHGVQNIGKYIG